MAEMLWWVIFIGPTLAATGWALWRTRPPGRPDTFDSVRAHRRFVEALSQSNTGRGDRDRSDRGRHRSERSRLVPRAHGVPVETL